MEIPAEEMIGAFLKQISTDSGIRYSFPHKGLQDFLAALFIWMRITAPLLSCDIQKVIKGFNDVFAKNNVSSHCSNNILRFAERELLQEASRKFTANTKTLQNLSQQGDTLQQSSLETSNRTVTPQSEADRITEQFMKIDNVPEKLSQVVCKVIKEGFENDPKTITQLEINTTTRDTEIAKIITSETSMFGMLPELSKFQNVLISLLGIFYMNPNSIVGDEITEEVLQLLQQSGIRGKDAWLNILNSVRCNTYVAMFISKIPEIMEGNIVINDSTLFAYISLMQALKPSLKDHNTPNVVIDVKGDLTGAENLLNLISHHQYNIKSISMNDENFSEYTILLESLLVPLEDSQGVNVSISVNKHLLELKDLLMQIKRNNLFLKKLQVENYQEIKDNQTADFISLLKGLPQHSDDGCQIPLSLQIRGNLTDSDELLELISFHHFQLDRVFVCDENIMQYTQLLKALKLPLINPDDVNFSVDITKCELASGLLHEIKKSSYSLKKFNIVNFQINDANLSECFDMIRSFPIHKHDANTTSTLICVKGNLGGTELLLDLTMNNFTVSEILVTSCNLSEYTTMLKSMSDNEKIRGIPSFHINLDEDLNTVRELIEEIKERKYKIGKLKLRRIKITDSNAHEVSSVLSSFPDILPNVNETSIDIDVSGPLTNADDLMKVITSKNFLLETILVTENNYKDYTTLIQSFTTKMLDVKLKVHISEDIFDIQNFIEVTKGNIKLSSFSIKTSHISDANLKKFITILESLPPNFKDVNESEVIVSIFRDLTGCEKVVRLLSNHHFQIRKLLITDDNVKKYSEIMKDMAFPLKTCPGGGIVIDIQNDISNLFELLSVATDHHLPVKRISVYQSNYINYIDLFETQRTKVNYVSTMEIELHINLLSTSIINLIDLTKRRQFHITTLSVGNVEINDDNICTYITVLRSLPSLQGKSHINGTIKVKINSTTSKLEELFTEIRRNKFQLEIRVLQDYRNPTSQLYWKDAFNSLQKSKIRLLTYQGAVVSGMLPQSISHLLWFLGSVADTDGYDAALDFMLHNLLLNDIQLCISSVVPSSYPKLQPIPTLRDNAAPSLFIADVVESTINNASALIKKLKPNSKNKKYDIVGFPRATLTVAGMKQLLSAIQSALSDRIHREFSERMKPVFSNYLVFPTSCKPVSPDDEKLLQDTALNALQIKISWGRVRFTPTNLDSW